MMPLRLLAGPSTPNSGSSMYNWSEPSLMIMDCQSLAKAEDGLPITSGAAKNPNSIAQKTMISCSSKPGAKELPSSSFATGK